MQISSQLPELVETSVEMRATNPHFAAEIESAAAESEALRDITVENHLAAGEDYAIGDPEDRAPMQPDSLMLNLDASLRVHTRAHFFGWTQGLLQSLIRHEVLVCALRYSKPLSFRADSFSMKAPEPAIFSELFLRDESVAANLIDAWVRRNFRPMICGTQDGSPIAGSAFARELDRLGATQLFVHGTHDVDGQVTSFFAFACVPGTLGPAHAYLAQLAVPFLHGAWVRSQLNVNARVGNESPKSAVANKVTSREQEILRWIYLGKSNFEIGAILGISPLTVKNHVQKILRKLNVVNRAQAVGKALELRVITP